MSPEIRLDHDRVRRIGLPEAILCAGKSAEQLVRILQTLDEGALPDPPAGDAGRDRPERPPGTRTALLLTRLEPELLAALPERWRARIDYDPVSRTATAGVLGSPRPGPVAVVSAGSSDVPVAREAVRTLHFCGIEPCERYDVGVAGLWRLLDVLPALEGQRAVIVAAGMDAALPSVVAGLVPGLVIAVPTSTGYGVASGGETALRAALASCAPGVVVVNIDNGYGAACAALRALGPGEET